MSSSSHRNANSRGKASSSQPRKRTQEVETGDGAEADLAGDPSEALTPPEGATAAQLASSALDVADHAVRAGAIGGSHGAENPTDGSSSSSSSSATPEVESFVGATENSPLGREIMGAAEDMAGDFTPEPRPSPGPSATPLEMMDETDLIGEAPPGTASGVIVGGTSPPAMRDEEFLRRVVLPPLPSASAGPGALPHGSYVDEDSQDKTVISDPPSPEMLAAFARPTAPAPSAFRRRLKATVEFTTLELVGLLTGTALAGGLMGALFMSTSRAGASGQVSAAAVLTAPAQAVRPTQNPSITPLPPPPRPTVESLPPPEERVAQPEETSTGTRAGSTSSRRSYKRGAAATRKPKKEWVDPFE